MFNTPAYFFPMPRKFLLIKWHFSFFLPLEFFLLPQDFFLRQDFFPKRLFCQKIFFPEIFSLGTFFFLQQEKCCGCKKNVLVARKNLAARNFLVLNQDKNSWHQKSFLREYSYIRSHRLQTPLISNASNWQEYPRKESESNLAIGAKEKGLSSAFKGRLS